MVEHSYLIVDALILTCHLVTQLPHDENVLTKNEFVKCKNLSLYIALCILLYIASHLVFSICI